MWIQSSWLRCGRLTVSCSPGVQCASNPVPIGVGYLGQYLIKPLLGFLIARVSPPAQQLTPCCNVED